MEDPIRIVSTKKLLPNQRQYLLNANFLVTEADFIGIKFKDAALKNNNDFLIFTSQNAVESILTHPDVAALKVKKCFCVGEKTKLKLEQNGFEVIKYATYAAELASLICNQFQKNSFTFLSGNLRQDIIPKALTLAQILFDEVETYITVHTPIKVLSKPSGILFFSPSAVDSYLKKNKISDEVCFCIGTTTAQALANNSEHIVVANHPTVENTLVRCINYYSN